MTVPAQASGAAYPGGSTPLTMAPCRAALGIAEAAGAAATAIYSLCECCSATLAAQWPLVSQLYAAVQAQGGAAPVPLAAAGQAAPAPAVLETDVRTVRCCAASSRAPPAWNPAYPPCCLPGLRLTLRFVSSFPTCLQGAAPARTSESAENSVRVLPFEGSDRCGSSLPKACIRDGSSYHCHRGHHGAAAAAAVRDLTCGGGGRARGR